MVDNFTYCEMDTLLHWKEGKTLRVRKKISPENQYEMDLLIWFKTCAGMTLTISESLVEW